MAYDMFLSPAVIRLSGPLHERLVWCLCQSGAKKKKKKKKAKECGDHTKTSLLRLLRYYTSVLLAIFWKRFDDELSVLFSIVLGISRHR